MNHLKDISNEELLAIYRLVLEHKEMLEIEKKKLVEEEQQ